MVSHGQAVCSVMRQDLDLVLLDCGYNVSVGLEILNDLKKQFPSVPVLFLSDQSSEEIILEVFRNGARDFFRKPVQFFQLRQSIKDLLELKRQAKDERQHYLLEDQADVSLGQLCNMRDNVSPGIMRAVCQIENQFAKALTLDDLARLAHMSKHHFTRQFSQEIKMSPVRYLKFVRVQRAKELLKRKKASVLHVALQVGFKDVNSFIRNFKHFEGCTPSRFRNGQE